MEKLIRNDNAWSVMIITGDKLGYKSEALELAKKVLLEHYSLYPSQIPFFSGEATRIHNLIAYDKKVYKANEMAQCIIKELGL